MIRKRRARRGGLLAVVAAVAASGLVAVAGAGPASAAAPRTLELDYHCTFPLIGSQAVHVAITADFPDTVPIGERMPGIPIEAVATVNAQATRALGAIGATTLDGRARADATLTVPEMPEGLPVAVDVTLERTQIPESGELKVRGTGTTPSLVFTEPGPAKIAVGDLVLALKPLMADLLPTGLGTFESECVQDPGQDNVLASFNIFSVGDKLAGYTLDGSTTLAASGGTAPLTGDLALDGDRAVVAFDPATVNFDLLGFLPITAEMRFGSAVSGTWRQDGDGFTGTFEPTVAFPAFRAFGVVPIGGGEQCRTSEPTELTLTSEPGFERLEGGSATGRYDLASLTGCGVLTGLLGDGVTGPGNTVEVALTPQFLETPTPTSTTKS